MTNPLNPTALISAFSADLSAEDRDGATVWTLDAGSVSFSDNQMHLDGSDAISIAPAGHLDSRKGSVSFFYTRESDTGSNEFLLECGEDGFDWLRIYVNSTDRLVLWFASGGSLPQTVQSIQTIATDTRYGVSCGWQYTTLTLTVTDDMGTQTVTGTRDVPVGSWGAGALVLEAA